MKIGAVKGLSSRMLRVAAGGKACAPHLPSQIEANMMKCPDVGRELGVRDSSVLFRHTETLIAAAVTRFPVGCHHCSGKEQRVDVPDVGPVLSVVCGRHRDKPPWNHDSVR